MLVTDNRKGLMKLAEDFYNISKTMISVYDINSKYVCSYPNKMSLFCTEIRRSEKLCNSCLMCDGKALKHCRETKSIYIYKCHMGLIEVGTPIISNNVIIGYLLFGQCINDKKRDALKTGAKIAAEKYNLDYNVLSDGIEKLKYRSDRYINSLAHITEMCASYICVNSIISVKNDSTANSLDIFIKNNLKEKLTVSSICSELYLSRSAIYNISKKYFGCGITDYIRACRIEAAKNLLKAGNMSIEQVAEAVGIGDENYFIRIFKNSVGVSPKKWQKMLDE